jgi:prevent-host-death family protein
VETVGAYEAKTRLSELLDRAAAGETITITKHGVPVARLTPFATPSAETVREAFAALARIRASALPLEGETIRDLIEEGRH